MRDSRNHEFEYDQALRYQANKIKNYKEDLGEINEK